MNVDDSRLFAMTLEEVGASLKANGLPPLTPGALTAMVATGLIHVSPETRRAQEQRQRFDGLSQKQQNRVHAYMREGLSFEQAYDAALRTDPVAAKEANEARLANINLPTPNPSKGRRLTRRQRRRQNR